MLFGLGWVGVAVVALLVAVAVVVLLVCAVVFLCRRRVGWFCFVVFFVFCFLFMLIAVGWK